MAIPDPPILPGLAEVIGAAKDRLTVVRPTAAPHLEAGNWSRVLRGWRGQYSQARVRLTAEVDAARLGTATADALSELAASNFDTPRQDTPLAGAGELVLSRTIVHYAASPTDPAITAPDASDENSFLALFAAMLASIAAHAPSVFDATAGVGAHAAAATPYATPLAGSTMGAYVDGANALKAWVSAHLADATAHPDADALDTLAAADATSSSPAHGYGLATLQERGALNGLANATKRVLNAHYLLLSRAGSIRKGTAVQLAADPAAVPPIAGGQYLTAQDTYVPLGARSIAVPVDASRPGPTASILLWASGAPTLSVTLRERLFDASSRQPLTVAALRAAGGSSGQPDSVLVAAARATWTGRYGPTATALVAGALRSLGVERVTVREDPSTGIAYVYPVDARWAQSDRWLAKVLQVLRSSWQGLGCRVRAGAVLNAVVRVEIVVALRDARLLDDTSALAAALQATVAQYFDGRPDYWIWRTAAIRALCSAVDRTAIKSCTLAIVRDGAGAQLVEPSDPAPGSPLIHWYFADKALSCTFIGPS